MLVEKDTIKSLMERMSQIEVESRDTYQIDGKRVPRVTEVLSAMLHEDYLMSWSNSLGWKRISYRAFMKEAADKGTYSHLAVEKFLRNGLVNFDEMNLPNDNIRNVVESCLSGFKMWWEKLHNEYKNIEIVYIEETMIHEYFGGTCDCLLKVDNKYYLVDFKTSNHVSYNYALQLAAYRFLLRELKGIEINRCTVLMLDKLNYDYKTYDLYFDNNDHVSFIEDCEQTFLTLVAAYKMRLYTAEEYYNVFGIEEYKKKYKD